MKKNRTVPFFLVVVALFYLSALPGCGNEAPWEPPNLDQAPGWETVKELYEKARKSGEQVPDDVVEWFKQDVAKFGDWEYRVVEVESHQAPALEEALNPLGGERWECFAVERSDGGLLFFLKRPARSYLKAVPARDLLRLLPEGQGN